MTNLQKAGVIFVTRHDPISECLRSIYHSPYSAIGFYYSSKRSGKEQYHAFFGPFPLRPEDMVRCAESYTHESLLQKPLSSKVIQKGPHALTSILDSTPMSTLNLWEAYKSYLSQYYPSMHIKGSSQQCSPSCTRLVAPTREEFLDDIVNDPLVTKIIYYPIREPLLLYTSLIENFPPLTSREELIHDFFTLNRTAFLDKIFSRFGNISSSEHSRISSSGPVYYHMEPEYKDLIETFFCNVSLPLPPYDTICEGNVFFYPKVEVDLSGIHTPEVIHERIKAHEKSYKNLFSLFMLVFIHDREFSNTFMESLGKKKDIKANGADEVHEKVYSLLHNLKNAINMRDKENIDKLQACIREINAHLGKKMAKRGEGFEPIMPDVYNILSPPPFPPYGRNGEDRGTRRDIEKDESMTKNGKEGGLGNGNRTEGSFMPLPPKSESITLNYYDLEKKNDEELIEILKDIDDVSTESHNQMRADIASILAERRSQRESMAK